MTPQYICAILKRRHAVLANPALNGIDFLEVLDQGLSLDSLTTENVEARCHKGDSGTHLSLRRFQGADIQGFGLSNHALHSELGMRALSCVPT